MKITKRVPSPDGITTKYLQEIDDQFVVETTYINRHEKHILCFSSQVGCSIQCTFCASGLRTEGGLFKRSLAAEELVEQCRNVVEEMDFATDPKRLLFSCMGEGEPFLNYDACVEAFGILANMDWPVPIRIAVSTSGIRPALIKQLADVKLPVPLKLQVSLHGPTDEIRQQLVRVTRPLCEILEATREYRDRCGRIVEFNYVLCAGVNDDLTHARQLAELLGQGWYVKFNRLNPTIGSPHTPGSRTRMEEFCQILELAGITTEMYETDGADIFAACGQLSYLSTQNKASLP